jgi:glycosyltransferase involved in cell wall biosynthesis
MNAPILSLPIPTLELRRLQCNALHDALAQQSQPTGWKRNALLERVTGEFVAFVDDDDQVSVEYVASISGARCP